MKKGLKRIAILVAPIVWRRLRGRRGRPRRRGGWHKRGHRPRHRGHKRRRIWL